MVWPHRKLLGHVSDHIGLADGLAAGDRHRLIGVGGIGKARLDEMFARHFVHRAQHRLVADAALTQRQHELHPLFAFVGRQDDPLLG